MRTFACLCFLLLLFVACGGQLEGAPGASGECADSADCGSGRVCGFRTADGCSAKGTCFDMGPMCNGIAPGCACDGKTINVMCNGLPGGYELAPLLHNGVCE